MSTPTAEAGAEPAPIPGRGLVATALALATFMQVLDTTIANVSIPTIAGDLGVSPDQGTWVITSFAVANGISVPLTGWLMQRFGVVRIFVASVLMFTLASLLCGMAWSLPSLILFRILQGATSGPMIPGSQALLLSVFPPHKRGVALAIWSMTTLVAPICGPILGGYISDNYAWPWIFFINIPVGLFCATICWQGLRNSETATRKLPVDLVGLGLLVVWVGCLQVMLDTGKDAGWFDSPQILVLGLVSLVSFVAFVVWELGERHPIVDLSLFAQRNFGIGTIIFCIGYAVFFGAVVLQPLWMQTWVGYNATWAGLVAAPSGLVAVAVSPLVGRNIGRLDARIFASISLLAYAVSYFMRAGYTADASFVAFTLPLLVQGIGMSMFFVSMISILLDGVPMERVPAASGLSNFTRIIAGSFATSMVTTLWDDRAALHQTRLADTSSLYQPQLTQPLQQLQAAGLDPAQAQAVLSHSLGSQAYLMSTLDFFWLAGWVCVLLLGTIWLTRKPKPGAAPVAAD